VRALLVLLAPLLVAATSAAQSPTLPEGDDAKIAAMSAPPLVVADKAFPLKVTVENTGDKEVTINLAPTFYAWSPEKKHPCGNQATAEYRGATSGLVASLTIPRGQKRTYPDDAGAPDWMQVVQKSWVAPGTGTYELCVVAVKPGYQNVAPVYEDLRNMTLKVRDENRAPTAEFTWSPAKGNETHPVTFTATAKDDDGDALVYDWDFGHLSTKGRAVGKGQVTTHAFYPAGTYTVTLTVRDGFDGTPVAHTIEILPESVPAEPAGPGNSENGGETGFLTPGAGLGALALAGAAATLFGSRGRR
jgi:hypothetical protein